MTRLSTLHKNRLHQQAEDTLFILRMRFKSSGSLPHKMDCINLFIQLRFLYEALEARLKILKQHDLERCCQLLSFFEEAPWGNRSKRLEADIVTMTALLTEAQKQALTHEIMPAFKTFVDGVKDYDVAQLFACFSVRCLGDVFGGQQLNEYNQRVFSSTPFKDTFYKGVQGQTQSISRHVNNAVLNEDEQVLFDSAVDATFSAHIKLFDEMEASRTLDRNRVCNRFTLFNVASAAVVVGIGAVVAYDFFNPKK